MSEPGKARNAAKRNREAVVRAQLAPADARRLEEFSLNASGAFQSLVYDGWLLGYRAGPTKRLRCVNPFYASTLPVSEKIEYCVAFYRAAGLPPLFRLLPFSQPLELDGVLERAGWVRFERTLVLHADLGDGPAVHVPAIPVEMISAPEWVDASAALLELSDSNRLTALERAQNYPLPHLGALVRRDGEVVGCGLVKLEADAAGLFALATAPALRSQGIGRAVVAGLLTEARRRGAQRAYLQVTAANAAALALYAHFGFTTAYDYWYRGLDR
jgi:ribosomal protein S18 acetylase RimI-like enzyme